MVIPLDVGALIVDILAHDEQDTNLRSLKACALVSRPFLPLCRKYIFMSIDINKPYSNSPTIRRIEELLSLNPDLAQYVRRLDFCIRLDDLEDPQLPHILNQFTRIQSLVLWHHSLDRLDWQRIPLSARIALVGVMHLPTLGFLRLRNIQNFSAFDLVPCVGLTHLQIDTVDVSDVHGEREGDSFSALPEPVRVLDYTFGINGVTTTLRLMHMRRRDGLPVVDFTYLKKFSGECDGKDDLSAVKFFLKGVEGLVTIHLKSEILFTYPQGEIIDGLVSELLNLRGFARIIASSALTLKNASFAIYINDATEDPLVGLCEELEEMRSKNVLEKLSICVMVLPDADCKRGHEWGKFDAVLSRPGWDALKLVSLQVTIWNFMRINADIMKVSLDMLLDTQFVHLSSNNNVEFRFKVEVKEI